MSQVFNICIEGNAENMTQFPSTPTHSTQLLFLSRNVAGIVAKPYPTLKIMHCLKIYIFLTHK